MGENQEKIETLEQSKQAEQDPASEQNQEGQHPEQPAPSREKEQQDEPPITEEEEELALELERFSTMYSTMAKMTIKMNDRLACCSRPVRRFFSRRTRRSTEQRTPCSNISCRTPGKRCKKRWPTARKFISGTIRPK